MMQSKRIAMLATGFLAVAALMALGGGRGTQADTSDATAKVPPAEQAKTPALPFNGLDMSLGNLSRLSNAKSRSISAENPTGEKGKGGMATEGMSKGAARDLGQGWKISPAVSIAGKSTFTAVDVDGPGAIQQIWITPAPVEKTRMYILRFYWDGETEPSVEVPLGDFFACGWGEYCQINSLPVCVNPGSAFVCQWKMPFRKHCKMTLENLDDQPTTFFYQVNYTLTDVPDDEAYFHAQFRRVPKLPYKTDYTILDGVKGRGQYVGTYMAYESKSNGWWGEGEIKFFFDGDEKFPTICGTGQEDYFCGSYGFLHPKTGRYAAYTTPFSGMPQIIPEEVTLKAPQRFGLYRWHIPDPVRFEKELKVTMQSLGWKKDGTYLPQRDDIASVAYWYQTEPHAKFPVLPDKETLRIKPITENKAIPEEEIEK
jgi:hypothetical protein